MKLQLKLNEVISLHAEKFPARSALVPALVFLEDGERHEKQLTYQMLHHRAQIFAKNLVLRSLQGERILLLFPSSLDYVVSFLGCLYAGVIAVPAYLMRHNWHAERRAAIVHAAETGTLKFIAN